MIHNVSKSNTRTKNLRANFSITDENRRDEGATRASVNRALNNIMRCIDRHEADYLANI